jgi:hypothetical protein
MRLSLLLWLALAPASVFGQVGSLFFQSAYSPISPAASPTFSITSPYSGAATTVTLSDATSGATIYYCQDTTNTCSPTTAGTSLSVSATGYIRASATASGYSSSAVASWQGTITTSCTSGNCSDAFVGTSGTALATQDPNWETFSSDYSLTGLTLNGSGYATPAADGSGGALYGLSTSGTSAIIIPAGMTSSNHYDVDVYGTSSSTATFYGYLAILESSGGTNWNVLYLYKGESELTGNSSFTGTFPVSAPHTLSETATTSGSNEVITVYIDGVAQITYTDSSSPLTTGNPGFVVNGGSAPTGGALVGPWEDYPYTAPPTFSPASPYTGAATTVTLSDATSGATIYYCQDTTNTCTPSTAGTSVSFTSNGYIRSFATHSGYGQSPTVSWQGTL